MDTEEHFAHQQHKEVDSICLYVTDQAAILASVWHFLESICTPKRRGGKKKKKWN